MDKKKLIIIGIILLIIVGVILFFLLKDDSSKTLELTYETSKGIPYRWEYEIEDETIVKLERSFVDDENKRQKGGIVHNHYVFSGLKEGKTKIRFKYVEFTKDRVEREEVANVKVDKFKNISLVGSLD
jgi:predicted secreted protein